MQHVVQHVAGLWPGRIWLWRAARA